MKVIFYIGHHKVGSTALQVFLSQNWHRLAQAGILYPSIESRGFANNLRRALRGSDKAAVLGVNIREPHSALAYKMMSDVSDRKVPAQFQYLPPTGQMFQALRNQVLTMHPETVILCSEAFANFGEVEPDLIGRLCRVFPGADFEVYCALRRPDDYLVSWHGQRLKVGEKLQPLAHGGLHPYLETIHFDYRKVVQAWADNVPKGKLILRNYADILKAGGSPQDFMDQTGANYPDGLLPAARANKSLPLAAMEVVRRGNHELPQHAARALCHTLLALDPGSVPVPNGDVEMFRSEQRETIAELLAPIDRDVAALAGTNVFFAERQDIMRSRAVPAVEAANQLIASLDPAGFEDSVARDYIIRLQNEPLG